MLLSMADILQAAAHWEEQSDWRGQGGGNNTCKSMFALANVHETSSQNYTVLTYIWQRPPLVPSKQFLTWPWRPQAKRTAVPTMILPKNRELAGPKKAVIGHGAFFNQELLLHNNKQRKCNNGMKTTSKSRKNRECGHPSTTLIHLRPLRRFDCKASSKQNPKNGTLTGCLAAAQCILAFLCKTEYHFVQSSYY